MNSNDRDRARIEAAQWCARLRAPDVRADEREAFERWRTSDPRNAAAFAAAERLNDGLAAWATKDPRLKALVDRAAGAGATLPDDPPDEDDVPRKLTISAGPVQGRGRRQRASRRLWAASIAAGIAAAVSLMDAQPRFDAMGARAEVRYSAGDARRAVTLEDGTRVYLDVAGVIAVSYSPSRRDVRLLQGRVLFDVAHDGERPFVVAAGTDRVTARGTVFQVDRKAAEVVVTLAQGAVTVDTQGSPVAPVLLGPGEEVRVSTGQAAVKRSVDARSATSWSVGKHIFREQRLADVVHEINRYAAMKVRLADAHLGDLEVNGEFATGDSAAIVDILSSALALQVSRAGNALVLSRDL
jgi:transmembrane sensor